jgi:hypothetical protein
MASQQLHVTQRTTGVMGEPGRAGNKCSPPRVGRTAVETNQPIGVGKPDTILCAVIGPPRSETITGPAACVTDRHAANAVRNSSCNGMTRPLRFLAAQSGNSRTVPMSPVGSVIMAHVRWAISPALNPALADSRTMTLFRNGCRLVSANSRRSSRLSSDRIFACFPRIAMTREANKRILQQN